MIDQFVTGAPSPRPDAGYKAWSASMTRAAMRRDPEDRTAGPIPTFGSMVHETTLAAQAAAQPYAPMAVDGATNGAKPDIAYTKPDDGEYTFADVLDVINPLQHLPVIGTLYRKMTGDTIKPMSGIIGGALFGGPIGAVAGTVNAIVKSTTGKDIAENALAFVGIDAAPPAPVKPAISYDAAVNVSGSDLPGTTLAVANLSHLAEATPKNFAAKAETSQVWNA